MFQAYEDIGIRANVGITLFDRPFFRAVPFVDEEFPKELLAELDGTRMYSGAELLDFVRGLAAQPPPLDQPRRLHGRALGAAALHQGIPARRAPHGG